VAGRLPTDKQHTISSELIKEQVIHSILEVVLTTWDGNGIQMGWKREY